MGQVAFNPDDQARDNSNGFDGPKFFSLKNNNDSAIVRFMYNSPSEFEIFETHKVVTSKMKFGKTVSCLRQPTEPTSNCPFCSSPNPDIQKVYKKFVVRMIEYVKDPATNTITPQACIWERPIGFAYDLAQKANLYGNLQESIFIITRHTPNPNNKQDTTYTVDLAPAQIYTPDLYPNQPELFADYKILGRAIATPTADDMNYYLTHGDFPPKQTNDQNTNAAPQVQAYNQTVQQVASTVPPASVVVNQQQFNPVANDAIPFTPAATAPAFQQSYEPTAEEVFGNPQAVSRPVRQ